MESKHGSDALHPRDIDAFWLQRNVSKHCKVMLSLYCLYNVFVFKADNISFLCFQDPIVAQKKSQECLEILRTAVDDRDLENRLVRCIGYEQFGFLRILRRNPAMILHCSLLAQAQNSQERSEIEAKMKADPKLAKILQQLRETTGSNNGVSEERDRIANKRVTRLRVSNCMIIIYC